MVGRPDKYGAGSVFDHCVLRRALVTARGRAAAAGK